MQHNKWPEAAHGHAPTVDDKVIRKDRNVSW